MELGFISSALKRFWPLIVLAAILGALPAYWLQKTQPLKYDSVATLMVRAPSESRTQTWSGDPDRYVIGQLGVLNSDSLADQVASEVGQGLTRRDISDATTVAQRPATDLVDITVSTTDPELSRQIADAYTTLYFVAVRSAVEESQAPDLKQLQNDLADVQAQLDDVDTKIVERMQPYLPQPGVGPLAQSAVPGVDVVAPDLMSTKETLLYQYSQLLNTKSDLELNARLRVTSEIVQRATLPDEPTSPTYRLFMAAGAIAGMFLGFIAAVLLARMSKRVSTLGEVETIVGAPVVGSFPHSRGLAQSRRSALEALPDKAAAFVDELCVRAEANASASGSALTVVVTGTERSAGTTTLASAMANRFAAAGQHVVLVDADPRHPELTFLYANTSPGIPALLALARRDEEGDRRGPNPSDPFSSVGVPGVRVVGIGNKSSGTALRRQNVPEIVKAAAHYAHVVVFDGGPVLDAASTVQLTQLCDAVVLAVPVKRQRITTLSAVVRQLQGRRSELLTVSMPAGRNRRSSRSNDVQRPGPVVEAASDAELQLAGFAQDR